MFSYEKVDYFFRKSTFKNKTKIKTEQKFILKKYSNFFN